MEVSQIQKPSFKTPITVTEFLEIGYFDIFDDIKPMKNPSSTQLRKSYSSLDATNFEEEEPKISSESDKIKANSKKQKI